MRKAKDLTEYEFKVLFLIATKELKDAGAKWFQVYNNKGKSGLTYRIYQIARDSRRIAEEMALLFQTESSVYIMENKSYNGFACISVRFHVDRTR